jgi:hypothetical protein
VELPSELAPVWADADQLNSLLNLVVNARDDAGWGQYCHRSQEASIDRRTPALYACRSLIRARMDAETLARATEPFLRPRAWAKAPGSGLPMVHGCHQSGGRLILKSEKGRGTAADGCRVRWHPWRAAAPPEVAAVIDARNFAG